MILTGTANWCQSKLTLAYLYTECHSSLLFSFFFSLHSLFMFSPLPFFPSCFLILFNILMKQFWFDLSVPKMVNPVTKKKKDIYHLWCLVGFHCANSIRSLFHKRKEGNFVFRYLFLSLKCYQKAQAGYSTCLSAWRNKCDYWFFQERIWEH